MKLCTLGLRHAWDVVMFKAIIAKRARVPAGDSFIVKRVAGPGLASNFFYQIKTEQTLVALEARMEVAEVEAYKVCEINIHILERLFLNVTQMASEGFIANTFWKFGSCSLTNSPVP